jgi:hypothetical protein
MRQFCDRGAERSLRREGADVQFVNHEVAEARSLPCTITPVKGRGVDDDRIFVHTSPLISGTWIGYRFSIWKHKTITVPRFAFRMPRDMAARCVSIRRKSLGVRATAARQDLHSDSIVLRRPCSILNAVGFRFCSKNHSYPFAPALKAGYEESP